MIASFFIQCFSETKNVNEELSFKSIFSILSSIWSKNLDMMEFYVLCRQSIVWLTTYSQKLNNIMKSLNSNRTFFFWHWILILFKQESYFLATAFIYRDIFEFITSYDDIAQAASLKLHIFLHMLHQQDNFDFIHAEHKLLLW